MKEKLGNFGKNVRTELDRRGIKYELVTCAPDSNIERTVRSYVMGIERAHEKAANSALIFRSKTPASSIAQSV